MWAAKVTQLGWQLRQGASCSGRRAFELVKENKIAKGDVLTTAKLAGRLPYSRLSKHIMAAPACMHRPAA